MEQPKEIEKIIFGIFSAQEILDMSVCKIDTTKLSGPGSVYDERMGSSLESNSKCVTCGMDSKLCPNHFGHIELNEPIIHPLFYKYVVAYLRCFCIECYRLLVTKDQLVLNDILKYKGEKRFKMIQEKLEKVNICCHCGNPQPTISYCVTDNSISMMYKEKIMVTLDDGEEKKIDSKTSIVLTVDDIKKTFDAISDEDVELCGFNPSRIHPRNLILTVFPVLPPSSRPFVIADGNTCDDDLTNQLLEMIKANIIIKNSEKDAHDPKKETKRSKAIQTLKFRILTYFNNSGGKAKHPTNGRPLKGIKERLTGN
jgi:DNA-directed RNA polymerase II subunit RPB1